MADHTKLSNTSQAIFNRANRIRYNESNVAPRKFNVQVSFGQMLAFLPVIFLAAALPLPFHAGALLLWTVLFPDYPEVGVFSLIMHTFFVLFNAFIGVLFLPKANAELFGDPAN